MRVGTSEFLPLFRVIFQDHPHACGDKRPVSRILRFFKGSSPCVWGQGKEIKQCQMHRRIIPMRVGTSVLQYLLYLLNEDHPHACGDKAVLFPAETSAIGSSPCVWGQVLISQAVAISPRIIPMRVGTSQSADRKPRKNKDHPHACGDKQLLINQLRPVTGSSPCVWGQEKQ